MTDQKIIQGLTKGEESAVFYIYERFQTTILSMLKSRGARKEDAEDVLQESILALLKKLPEKELILKQGTFSQYFQAICLNKWYNICRRKNFITDITPEEINTLASYANIELDLWELELRDIIKGAFEKLQQDCQAIIRLYIHQAIDLKTVAERLDISYTNARQRASRCRRRWRHHVETDTRYIENY